MSALVFMRRQTSDAVKPYIFKSGDIVTLDSLTAYEVGDDKTQLEETLDGMTLKQLHQMFARLYLCGSRSSPTKRVMVNSILAQWDNVVVNVALNARIMSNEASGSSERSACPASTSAPTVEACTGTAHQLGGAKQDVAPSSTASGSAERFSP